MFIEQRSRDAQVATSSAAGLPTGAGGRDVARVAGLLLAVANSAVCRAAQVHVPLGCGFLHGGQRVAASVATLAWWQPA